jgi:Ca-activated chloride channel family protein
MHQLRPLDSPLAPSRRRLCWLSVAIGVIAASLPACRKEEAGDRGAPSTGAATTAAPGPAGKRVRLDFAYGSEKQAWLADAIESFNREQAEGGGELIVEVVGTAMGSGESVTDIVEGKIQPHIWSPASDVYRPLLQDAWTRKQGAVGGGSDIAADSTPLVLSPVVIAMWKPMAEALGWPGKALGWSDILALAKHPEGWASVDHPEWGVFKLGHTHPEFSNSGLLAILAEAYAAAGTTKELTREQLDAPATRAFLQQIESSIVHYGKSTGFFASSMLERGPAYLSAAVLYENLVIDSYKQAEHDDRPFDLVAIYPREGTFWTDNPLVIVNAPWVTDEHRRAAAIFRDHLLSKPVQTRAMTEYGFRPADPSIAITAPITPAFGVDPKQPQTLLSTPRSEVIDHAIEVWKQTKKTVDILFVFDRSGSMKGEPLKQAKQGARDFLTMLDDRDRVSLLMFNHEVPAKLGELQPVGSKRKALEAQVENTFADGGTALYDAIAAAHAKLHRQAVADPRRIFALVVLSDGVDEHSRMKLDELQRRITPSAELGSPVRLFTIAYGAGADPKVLQTIAEAAGGAFFTGDPATIRQVYRDLAAFF